MKKYKRTKVSMALSLIVAMLVTLADPLQVKAQETATVKGTVQAGTPSEL